MVLKKIFRKIKNLAGLDDSPDGVVILMYHRVNDALPSHNLIVRINAFEEQMRFLYSRPDVCRVVSLKEFESNPRALFAEKYPRLKVIITLDDGYRDNYLNAFPILKRFGFPAAISLTTGLVGTDKKFARYDNVSGRDMLNWDEISEMYVHKISFVAHTVSHLHLPQLSLEDQRREIAESYNCVNRNLPPGDRLLTFCYPYGEYNADTIRIVQELGFKYALSVIPGVNTVDTSAHALRRIEVSGMDNIRNFEHKIVCASA